MVRRRWLEGFVTECGRVKGQKARDFEEIELVIGGFRYRMPRQVSIHEGKSLLLALVLDGFGCPGAVCPAFVVARIELFIVEFALIPWMSQSQALEEFLYDCSRWLFVFFVAKQVIDIVQAFLFCRVLMRGCSIFCGRS